MSFWKKLFGGQNAQQDAPAATVEHEGYTMSAEPQKEGGQWRLAGTVSRQVGGETKTHRLVRADLFADRNEAIEAFYRKAKLVIAQQGERMFG
jgi:hypothetical protein